MVINQEQETNLSSIVVALWILELSHQIRDSHRGAVDFYRLEHADFGGFAPFLQIIQLTSGK